MANPDHSDTGFLKLTCGNNTAFEHTGHINVRRIDWKTFDVDEYTKNESRRLPTKFDSNASPFFPGRYPQSAPRPTRVAPNNTNNPFLNLKPDLARPFANHHAYPKGDSESHTPDVTHHHTHERKGKAKDEDLDASYSSSTLSYDSESEFKGAEIATIGISLNERLRRVQFEDHDIITCDHDKPKSETGSITPQARRFSQLPTPEATPAPFTTRPTCTSTPVYQPPNIVVTGPNSKAVTVGQSLQKRESTETSTGLRKEIPSTSESVPQANLNSNQAKDFNHHLTTTLPSPAASSTYTSNSAPEPKSNNATISESPVSTLSAAPSDLVPAPADDTEARMLSLLKAYSNEMKGGTLNDPEFKTLIQMMRLYADNNPNDFKCDANTFLKLYFNADALETLVNSFAKILGVARQREEESSPQVPQKLNHAVARTIMGTNSVQVQRSAPQASASRRAAPSRTQAIESDEESVLTSLEGEGSQLASDEESSFSGDVEEQIITATFKSRKYIGGGGATLYYLSESTSSIKAPPMRLSEPPKVAHIYVHKNTSTTPPKFNYWVYMSPRSTNKGKRKSGPQWCKVKPVTHLIQHPAAETGGDPVRWLGLRPENREPSWNKKKPTFPQ